MRAYEQEVTELVHLVGQAFTCDQVDEPMCCPEQEQVSLKISNWNQTSDFDDRTGKGNLGKSA